jgi:hypothetical protein
MSDRFGTFNLHVRRIERLREQRRRAHIAVWAARGHYLSLCALPTTPLAMAGNARRQLAAAQESLQTIDRILSELGGTR